nr:serine/threonine-protein kinase [Methylomarinum sp. Ch1-1]MDP4521797.1 serine/threonine-protein kinase [Methylomarinum sp. Ch1-1]
MIWKQRIETGLTPDAALKQIKLIARCLDFVHQKGIIHRDIKPENILFRTDDSLVLTDFGVAKLLQTDTSLTMDGSTIGSPHYISPEQAQQRPLDPRTDIYSLGIMFYEMLTGQKPFQGDTPIETIIAHLTTEAAPLPDHLTRYQQLVDLMIATDADNRFASTADLIDYIESFQNTGSKHAITHKFNKIVAAKKTAANTSLHKLSSAPQSQRRLHAFIGLGLAITLAGATALYYFHPKEPTEPADNVLAADVAENAVAYESEHNEIQHLLDEADAILTQANLSLPALRQALAIYNQALTIAPDDARTLTGIRRVAVLDRNIRDEIDLNLSEADKAIRAFRLTTPANDNAMFYYHRALTLAPAHPEAQQGKFKIADAYADLVESNLSDFRYAKAKANLDKGLAIDPTSARLLALKNKTNAFTDAPKRLFGKVTSIFD